MICKKCKRGKHRKCKGGTWCDCQHRVRELTTAELQAAIDRLLMLPDIALVMKEHE